MVYNYYLEGISNNILIKHYIEGYKTIKTLEKARIAYCERFKVSLLGQCLFSFNGINKYKPESYKIINQFNCKPYFEYWK